jgi:outer membrane protein OmpA-like peptidoglycan-associated protein
MVCALAIGVLGACASMESGSGKGGTSAKMAKKEMAAKPKKKKKKKKRPASGTPFTVYFKLNSVDLTEKSQGDLFDIMQKVRVYKPKTVEVIAHTDLSGSPAGNLKISKERADALAKQLKSAGAKKVVAMGVGSAEPIVDTKKPNQANRRAIIIFKKK